ncbi:MAG: hypothetical protein N7Q72_05940, partial [Spiroplasma sp. Tabriz.8]|nr:hypothetical protein [Spiroplasma sp. Tabriz.8]
MLFYTINFFFCWESYKKEFTWINWSRVYIYIYIYIYNMECNMLRFIHFVESYCFFKIIIKNKV